MKGRDLFSFVLTHISKHKFSFIISNIVILISSFILLQTMMDNYRLDYDYIAAKQTVSCDSGELLCIEVPLTSVADEEGEQLYRFVSEGMAYGISWYDYSDIIFNEGNTGKRFSEVLYVDGKMLEIMNLLDEEGKELDVAPKGNIYPLIVGSHAAKRFPKGTRLTAKVTGEVYEVTQVLPEGSKWLSHDAFNALEKVVLLDEYMITEADIGKYAMGYDAITLKGNIMGLQEKVDREKLMEISRKYNNCITIKSMQQLIDEKRQENSIMYDLSRLLVACIGIAMIIFIISVSVVIWLGEQRNIGILMSFGYTGRDVLKIVSLENMMRAVLPCIVLWLFFFVTTKTELDSVFYVKALAAISMLNVGIMITVSLLVYQTMKKSVVTLVKEKK